MSGCDTGAFIRHRVNIGIGAPTLTVETARADMYEVVY